MCVKGSDKKLSRFQSADFGACPMRNSTKDFGVMECKNVNKTGEENTC